MTRYKLICVDGKVIPEHRKIWEDVHGPIPKGYDIHHINGDGKDNRIENLMCLSHSEHLYLHARLRRQNEDVVDPTNPDVIYDREKRKRHYYANRDKTLAQHKKYYAEHVNVRKEYVRSYRQRFHDEIIERDRARDELRTNYKRASNKAWRDAHKAEIALKRAEWAAAHKADIQATNKARRDITNSLNRMRAAYTAGSVQRMNVAYSDYRQAQSAYYRNNCINNLRTAAIEDLAVFSKLDP